MARQTCICGEDLNYEGECWQGSIMGGHQSNCVECGKNALLDGMRCCSAECDIAYEEKNPGCCDGPGDDEVYAAYPGEEGYPGEEA